MLGSRKWAGLCVLALAPGLGQVAVAEAVPKAAVVCNIKVLSDKVEDVSSLEAWKKSFIKDGMSDQEKALAIWRSVAAFTYDTSPPKEFLTWEDGVDDPIKCFNVYGYDLCNDIASQVTDLARYSGFKAQGWSVQGHNVADVWYDGGWHYLDAAFVGYFPKADGTLASTEEIFAGVKKWYEANPEFKGDAAMNKRKEFRLNEGWKNGPEIMRNCPTYDKNGNLPHYGHGWNSDMREFDGKVKNIYETGYSNGYQVNIRLRAGEKLVRNWSNQGLHVNLLGGGGEPTILKSTVGEGELKHTPAYGDLANGRIGNGTLEYDALEDGSLATSALAYENLTALEVGGAGGRSSPLGLVDATKDGVLVIRMACSYVYLSGEATVRATVGQGGSVDFLLSDNNGLDWKAVSTIQKTGEQKIDLSKWVGRRYDYRLKVILKGKGTQVGALKISHDIQNSQRALPALDKGDNTITFSAGPPEDTITIEGSTTVANKDRQLILPDFHPVMAGMEISSGVKMTEAQGQMTLPIETPGEMTAIRVGTFYRAKDARDVWQIEASFDEGKTWKAVSTCEGGTRAMGNYAIFTDIPKGARKALVRYSGTQASALMIFNLRIDADYKRPGAGFSPVKVTYVYAENGVEKTSEHVVEKASESWILHCDAKPVMKSIMLELAQ